MDLEALVKMITEEVVSKFKNEVNEVNKKAVILFTGGSIGVEESIEQIKKIKAYGFRMKAVLSEFAVNVVDMDIIKEIFNEDDIYIDSNFENNKDIYNDKFDLLIGANLTVNSAAKAASGICDTLPTRLISTCIMNGTKILMVKDACDLRNPKRRDYGYKNIPIAYANMLKGYLDRLESFGIRLVNSENLFDYAANKINVDDIQKGLVSFKETNRSQKEDLDQFNNRKVLQETNLNNYSAEVNIKRKIISREDIALNSNTKTIIVPNYAIITSLAKDLADEMDIQIIKR